MMEREFAKFFVRLVNEVIPDNGEKEKLFETLRQYKSNRNLEELLTNLRGVLDEPSKLEVYEYMRPLVLLHHQLEFSQSVPNLPGVKLRTVRLHRKPGESLGFAVRGGFEHGVGIFVTHLTSGSQAHKQGLKLGDEIVRVNGFTISEAIHDDVLNLIKSRDDIVLRVTHIGMIPVKELTSDPVNWKYVRTADDLDANASLRKPRDLKIFVDTTGYTSFGCGILSGPSTFRGIFIEKVRTGSLAEEVGLEVGDQIVQVNDTNFQNITHDQAKLAIKSSRQLTITIRQQVGLKIFNQLRGQHSNQLNIHNSNQLNGQLSNQLSGQLSNQLSGQHSNQLNGQHSNELNGQNSNQLSGQHSISTSWRSNNSTIGVDDVDSLGRRLTSPSEDSMLSLMSSTNNPSSNHSPSYDNNRPARRENTVTDEVLDQRKLIAQELERQFLGSNSSQRKMTDEAQPASQSSSIVTVASIHSDYATVEKGKKDEVQQEKMSPVSSSSCSSEIRDELDERKKSQQSSPLSGAAAVAAQIKLQGSTRPSLLGLGESFTFVEDVSPSSYTKFSSSELDGRPLRALKYKKADDLGVGLEGGLGSPLAEKIMVAMIFDDGVAKKSGKLHVGDQLMAVNGQRLLDMTVAKAETMLQNTTKDIVELLFCESSLINQEDTVTFF